MIRHTPTDVVQYDAKKEEESYQKAARIKNEIDAGKKTISDLEEKKKKYEQMKEETNELVGELKSARTNIRDSKTQLQTNYSSQDSKNYEVYLEKFNTEDEKIQNIIRKLNNIILPGIEDNIDKIKKDIKNRQNIIYDLETQLNSIYHTTN